METTKRQKIIFKKHKPSKFKSKRHTAKPLGEIDEVLIKIRHKLERALKIHNDESAIKRLIKEAQELL